MHYEVFANGTEVLIAEDHRVPCAALQVWVQVGSLHEQEGQHGMAHFIEHMLFKGTPSSKAGELWQRVESWGGDINAYTDYDRTVYHLTLHADYTREGIAALHDAIYHSELSSEEIAREKEVVCEEINHYLDDPNDRLYEKARQLAFQGQVHPILGDSSAAVRVFTDENLRTFYRMHYVPRNITVTAVGAFDSAAVQAQITQLFGGEPDCPVPQTDSSTVPFAAGVQSAVVRGDYHKPRLLLALPAPCQHDIDTFALDCAAYVLGGSDAARLQEHVRDRQRLASAISCTNASAARWGMLEIAALTEIDHIPALIAALMAELQRLRQRAPLNKLELARARANAKADFADCNETVAGLADSLAHGLTTPWKYLFSDCYFALLEKISPPLVQRVLARWLNFERAVIVCAVAEDAALNEAQLTDSFQQARTAKTASSSTTAARQPAQATRQLLTLQDGLQLIHQPTTSELCNLVAVTHGGLAYEDGDNNGMHKAIASLLGRANRDLAHRRMTLAKEGRGAVLDGFSDTDALGLHLQCLKQDAKRFGKIFASCLLHARFPAAVWQVNAAQIADSIALQEEDPFSFCLQKFRAAMFAGHPYGMPTLGTDPARFQSDKLLHRWQACLTRGRWVFAASVALPTAQLRDMLQAELGDFSPPAHTPTIAALPALTANGEHAYPMAREQCHIVYGMRGMRWQDPQRPALDVLLKLKAQRLFDTLREQQGLVYTVSPILTYAVGAGAFGIYTACAPDKAEQASEAIAHELRHGKPPAVDEMTRARQFLAGNWNSEMSRGDRQAMHLARMQLFGVGHDNLDTYPHNIKKVSAADLASLTARLLHEQPHVYIKVGG